MGRLDNKKIVVCGGSTGIGHAVSVLAAKEGALVLNLDLQEADQFKTYNCNLTDISSARDAVGSLLSDYGHVDGMVNAVRLRSAYWRHIGKYDQSHYRRSEGLFGPSRSISRKHGQQGRRKYCPYFLNSWPTDFFGK